MTELTTSDYVTSDFTAVDLFCGAGGLSIGLEQAGFRVLFASDWDKHACETYRRNLATTVYVGPASDLTAHGICSQAGVRAGELALVCGGPPCQGFSIQRRGERQDRRNDLVLTFTELALGLQPRMILIENVPGLLGQRGRAEFNRVVSLLGSGGYNYDARVLDAADFGVPQRRRRAFIVAWDPKRVDGYQFPKSTLRPVTWRSVRDAISDIPEPPEDYSEHIAFPNHKRVRISALNERRIAHVPPGGGRADLPLELQLPCHQKDNGHRHLDVFGRMGWDRPAPTLTAMFDNFTRGRFAHPVANRSITAREGARLQTFPDTFCFYGPKKDVARQIGNAVPPLLAKALGVSLVAALKGHATLGASSEIAQIPLPLQTARTEPAG